MAEQLDAFGNPIGGSQPTSARPIPAGPDTKAPMSPAPAEPTAKRPLSSRPGRAPLVGPFALVAIRLAFVGAIVAAGALVRSAGNSVQDVTSNVPSITLPGGQTVQVPQEVPTDYESKPFAEGSMFRSGNLARAVKRAQKAAPNGARAVSVSVFAGYMVVTYKRKNGDQTSVSAWADGRTIKTDSGGAGIPGRKTFNLSAVPLSPMVKYVRSRAQALGSRAKRPYAVLIDKTTTVFSGGQLTIKTKPAAAWLIGFDGVPASKRTVPISLQGRRIK